MSVHSLAFGIFSSPLLPKQSSFGRRRRLFVFLAARYLGASPVSGAPAACGQVGCLGVPRWRRRLLPAAASPVHHRLYFCRSGQRGGPAGRQGGRTPVRLAVIREEGIQYSHRDWCTRGSVRDDGFRGWTGALRSIYEAARCKTDELRGGHRILAVHIVCPSVSQGTSEN